MQGSITWLQFYLGTDLNARFQDGDGNNRWCNAGDGNDIPLSTWTTILVSQTYSSTDKGRSINID